jgi:hypothetical protein
MYHIKKMMIIILLILLLVFFVYFFFIAKAPEQKYITWGVNFSQMQSEALHLDWKENYLALIEDLKVKNMKLLPQWDWIEGKEDDFYFQDTDWQVSQAESHDVNLIYVIGMKTGRWPECHVPSWAETMSKTQQQEKLLAYITQVILHYKGSKAIVAWQAENEPLFNFGQCPWYDKDFLKKEVALIKSLDPSRPVIVSDSGEQSMWFGAAKIGDIVGVTMYRKVWMHITDSIGFYFDFPLPPQFYWRKAQLINSLFGKKVISIELQAEPWVYKLYYDVPLAEQEKSMNLNQFKENVSYAQQTGLPEFYFWGAEWWYWLKTTQHQPDIWNEAQKLFQNS